MYTIDRSIVRYGMPEQVRLGAPGSRWTAKGITTSEGKTTTLTTLALGNQDGSRSAAEQAIAALAESRRARGSQAWKNNSQRKSAGGG